ncbi:PH domain-containing protein [Ilumatobacter sp.]|uniref:PH domain-containing protein n=1 Tax=Ilumatobacter sp. TaxID=1967498 RepID=UPI003B51ECD4
MTSAVDGHADREGADRRLLAQPTRQSPLALLLIAWRFLRRAGIVNLVVAVIFVASGTLQVSLWIVGVVAATVLAGVATASWWRFTFVVHDDELIVTRGLATVERLIVPLDRIQSVGIEQQLLHRLAGLVSATVDTAGSTETELRIDAVVRDRAEALARLAAEQDRGRAPSATGGDGAVVDDRDDGEIVLRRTALDLVRVGAARLPWAGLVALAPLFALADDVRDLVGVDLDADERLADDLATASAAEVLVVVLIGSVFVTVVGFVLQVVRQLVTNWDLTVRHTRGGLRRTAGLLTKTSRASSLRRVQTIATERTPAHRWLGIREIELRTVGEGSLSLPGSTGAELGALRRLVLGTDAPPAHDRMVSEAIVLRAVRNRAVIVVPLTIALVSAGGPWFLVLLALVPVRWLTARARWRRRRWGVTDDRLCEAHGWLTHRTGELSLVKVQTVTVTRSLFERRRDLATVDVRTAQGHLEVPLIAHEEARALRDHVLAAVETSRRPFM